MKPLVREGLVLHLDSIRFGEYDDDGFLGYQIDADGQGTDASSELEAQVTPFEALHPYGFLSRALEPDVDGGGQLQGGALSLTIWEGARGYSVALHDARVVPALARCKPGESVQYGPRNNFVRCHDDGRISAMCTDDGTEQGRSIYSEVGPNGFTWSGPWATLRHDALGVHYQHASGATFDVGGASGLPPPLGSLGSYFKVSAAIVAIKGQTVQLGTGTFEPPAKALTLQGALNLVAASLTALGAVPQNGGASAAITAAVEAIAALTTTMPARSVQVG